MGNQKKVDCKKSAQYCSNGVPKTSEELLNMRYPKKTETPKPWELKLNANIGYHIGGALDGPMPDYYGETENSANVPYVSDVIPSNQNLMLCSGGTQALGCLFSLGASLLPYQYGPPNTDSNYFVSFQVNYNEASGVTMSDVYWANHYEGQAILRQIKIGKEVKLVDSVYMPTDGQYRPIVESGASFDGSKPVWIEIAIDTWISGPNGSGTFREPLPPIIIPSLQGVKDYMQR